MELSLVVFPFFHDEFTGFLLGGDFLDELGTFLLFLSEVIIELLLLPNQLLILNFFELRFNHFLQLRIQLRKIRFRDLLLGLIDLQILEFDFSLHFGDE